MATEIQNESALTVDLSGVSDESRPNNEETFVAFLPQWQEATKRAVSEHIRATGAAKKLAQLRVQARAMIIRASGFPDWQADSDTYSLTVQAVETPIVAAKLSADAKRRFDASVRQHVKRNYLLPGIVGHIVTTEANWEEGEAFVTATTEEEKAEAMQALLADPSDKLKRRVREHYGAAGLLVPEGTFAEVVTNPTPGPVAGDPPSALKALETGLAGLSQIVPSFGVVGLLRAVTAISEKLLAGKLSEVKDRPTVIAGLRRIGSVAIFTADSLDSATAEKLTDEDEKNYDSAKWSKDDEQ